jgi:hypothetical protein
VDGQQKKYLRITYDQKVLPSFRRTTGWPDCTWKRLTGEVMLGLTRCS